jgi:DNA topoisomerase VI subunit B
VRARAHADREMKRRSLFEKYIPEVAGAIGEILGIDKGKVEKPFYATLPVFVRFDAEEPAQAPAKDDKATAAATPSVPPPPETPPPPPPAGGKRKKKPEQLRLVE